MHRLTSSSPIVITSLIIYFLIMYSEIFPKYRNGYVNLLMAHHGSSTQNTHNAPPLDWIKSDNYNASLYSVQSSLV